MEMNMPEEENPLLDALRSLGEDLSESEQATKSVVDLATVIATFHKTLKANGVPDAQALKLTTTWMVTLLQDAK
jgi:hypothetical protein